MNKEVLKSFSAKKKGKLRWAIVAVIAFILNYSRRYEVPIYQPS